MKYLVLYNPTADNGRGKENAEDLRMLYDEDLEFIDIRSIRDFKIFFSQISPNDGVIVCGGDGTLNVFINKIKDLKIENPILYFPCGSGNDFARDIGYKNVTTAIDIKKYLLNLPKVTVKGKTSLFLNGVGFGIDGYCCEEGDIQRLKGKGKINYTTIAIKGLLFRYKPTSATIIVDGVEHHFKNVWLCPTMNGRFYGGGMMPAPNQDRLNSDKKLTVMLFHGRSRLKTLVNFPAIFEGKHVEKKKVVALFEGKDITVKFDSPRPLQIDGETILNVTEYSASV